VAQPSVAHISENATQSSQRLVQNVALVVRGKEEVIKLAVVSLLARGHLLLEDVPGVGKTTLARSLAASIGVSFRRLQCTSDLMPTDVLGGNVFNQLQSTFEFRPGPIFTQVLLADEVNRTTPKTQSALLEAMDERQVSIDGETHRLEEPFFVVATQNPQEFYGTYPLPESQLDRFLVRLSLGYPPPGVEREVLTRRGSDPVQQLAISIGLSLPHETPRSCRSAYPPEARSVSSVQRARGHWWKVARSSSPTTSKRSQAPSWRTE